MRSDGMKKNASSHILNSVARWKVSIPVISSSLWIHRNVWRAPLISIFVVYLSFLCVSSIYSSIQFASAMQANLYNIDNLSANTSPDESGTLWSTSDSTLRAPPPSNYIFTTPANTTRGIPRIIHRMWRDLNTNTPAESINASKSCQEQNPSYIEYVWTDETAHQFIESHFTWFLSTYMDLPLPLQRIDALRYFLLWHFGGIYLDPEVGCQQPMEPLLNGTKAIMPESWPYGVSQQLIASKPNHPFVVKVARSIHDIHGHGSLVSGYVTAIFNTGSVLISHVLADWLRSTKEDPDIAILPSELFLGTKGSIFKIYDSQVPLGDEVYISQFVFENPFGWLGAAIALSVTATIILSIRMSPRRLREQTSTRLIV
ncbi:mannosyl phosphorylinositol ceramide synthase SUR1 [Penicillium frequentans]|uniref:Mannosyl phosphorylinositol ceramide synthase SUR1 n=1 Tax=Penicillium frequentans TaxID=3151616 RepID=A0AAD6D5X2_9EURO|nr:mannosyl phosphorylinositol ceramide synthase SUR1 [Penicillium glabrum]